jgi:hypothetical protein
LGGVAMHSVFWHDINFIGYHIYGYLDAEKKIGQITVGRYRIQKA